MNYTFTTNNYKSEFKQYVSDLISKYDNSRFKDLTELKEAIRTLGIDYAIATNKQPSSKQVERLTQLFLKAGSRDRKGNE